MRWFTKRQPSEMLETTTDNIGLHLKNIYASGELMEATITENFSVVQQKERSSGSSKTKHDNLNTIISVDDQVDSKGSTQFLQP